MTARQDTDWLSIRDAGRLLQVSRTTIHRWLKEGRLRAYRVGPRAVRIRRADLEHVITPVHADGEELSRMNEAHLSPIQTTIRPLTEEEVRCGRAALEASRALIARMRARRGGVPYAPSWPLIRQERAEREQRR